MYKSFSVQRILLACQSVHLTDTGQSVKCDSVSISIKIISTIVVFCFVTQKIFCLKNSTVSVEIKI